MMTAPTIRLLLVLGMLVGGFWVRPQPARATNHPAISHVPVGVTYVIRDQDGRVVTRAYTIEVIRVGSRVLPPGPERLIINGQPDRQGYVGTHVQVPCDRLTGKLLKQLFELFNS